LRTQSPAYLSKRAAEKARAPVGGAIVAQPPIVCVCVCVCVCVRIYI
jgi:hypothetical protein